MRLGCSIKGTLFAFLLVGCAPPDVETEPTVPTETNPNPTPTGSGDDSDDVGGIAHAPTAADVAPTVIAAPTLQVGLCADGLYAHFVDNINNPESFSYSSGIQLGSGEPTTLICEGDESFNCGPEAVAVTSGTYGGGSATSCETLPAPCAEGEALAFRPEFMAYGPVADSEGEAAAEAGSWTPTSVGSKWSCVNAGSWVQVSFGGIYSNVKEAAPRPPLGLCDGMSYTWGLESGEWLCADCANGYYDRYTAEAYDEATGATETVEVCVPC